MTADKFNENDRSIAISQVQTHFAVKLSRVGAQRKVLQDTFGRIYWVLGGYQEWHGISQAMLDEALAHKAEDVLVIAKRGRKEIESFYGPLQPLLSKYEALSHTESGNYQFHVSVAGDVLTIVELPGVSLRTMGTMPAPDNVEAVLAAMSIEELAKLLELRKSGIDG